MTDFLDSAIEWLDGIRAAEMAQAVVYRRGAATVILAARVGQTDYQTIDSNGFPIEALATDFIVSASGLILAGEIVEPAPGDTIQWTRGAFLETYEVMEMAGGACFRPDPTRHMLRIHAKRILCGS